MSESENRKMPARHVEKHIFSTLEVADLFGLEI